MRPPEHRQIATFIERLVTRVARIRFISSVRPMVYRQMVFTLYGRMTFHTRHMGTVFRPSPLLVYVWNKVLTRIDFSYDYVVTTDYSVYGLLEKLFLPSMFGAIICCTI